MEAGREVGKEAGREGEREGQTGGRGKGRGGREGGARAKPGNQLVSNKHKFLTIRRTEDRLQRSTFVNGKCSLR